MIERCGNRVFYSLQNLNYYPQTANLSLCLRALAMPEAATDHDFAEVPGHSVTVSAMGTPGKNDWEMQYMLLEPGKACISDLEKTYTEIETIQLLKTCYDEHDIIAAANGQKPTPQENNIVNYFDFRIADYRKYGEIPEIITSDRLHLPKLREEEVLYELDAAAYFDAVPKRVEAIDQLAELFSKKQLAGLKTLDYVAQVGALRMCSDLYRVFTVTPYGLETVAEIDGYVPTHCIVSALSAAYIDNATEIAARPQRRSMDYRAWCNPGAGMMAVSNGRLAGVRQDFSLGLYAN